MNVQSDGTILQQKSQFSGFRSVQLKDTLQLLVIPVIVLLLPAASVSATHSLGAVAAENDSPSDVNTAATPAVRLRLPGIYA